MRQKAELTEEAQKKIEALLLDLRSNDAKVRMSALHEVKKFTLLYGRDALSAVEDALQERLYDKAQQEMEYAGGAGIVWD